MRNLYENTWLYDLVHEKAADSEQLAFYQRQIEKFGSPVLELACGSGNYLVTLSKNDVEISGLDISPEMLSAAEVRAEKENAGTNLYNGDMRNFDLDEKFNLIFIAGNSLQHLNTNQDVSECFASVRRNLKPEGKFVVEVFNPLLPLLCRDENVRYLVGEFETEDGFVTLTENVFYDAATQINHIRWHYKTYEMIEEETVAFTMRQFFPQEFDALFMSNGFKIEQKFGDFEESDFTRDSPKQIIVASMN